MTQIHSTLFTPEDILSAAASLIEGERDLIATMANLSALLFEALPEVNWAGFYRLDHAGKELILGPFQGRIACSRIGIGQGVCGTAAQKKTVQRVADVHKFPGHIACDSRSASEIVLPVFKPLSSSSEDRGIYAVLDIDSVVLDRFSAADQIMLEKLVALFEQALKDRSWNNPEADQA